MGRYTDEAAHVLAERAYPRGASGLCSTHPAPDATCTTCFPDPWSLVDAHNRLKQLAWARLRELGEMPPGLSPAARRGCE